MKCTQAEQWLQLYVDNRLDARRLALLERHIELCATCQEDFVLLELVTRAVAAPIPVREPEGLAESVMRRVAAMEAQRASVRGVFEPGWVDAMLAAILATLVTIGFLIFQPALRLSLSDALTQALLTINHAAIAALGDSPGWLAWSVGIGLGLLLTLAFAGGEVRATWRRNLMTRLPH